MNMIPNNSFRSIFLAMAFLVSSSAAIANSPPEFQEGSINPDSHLILDFQDLQPATDGRMGQSFFIHTEWNDADDDFVVDVTVRYKNRRSSFWLEVVLDYVPGTNPPQFSKEIIIDGLPGEYEYAFRASDAEIADGPRLHTTDWISGGTINILRPNDTGCIGNVFEQNVDEATSSPPIVSVDTPPNAQEGSRITLTANYELATEGTPFFLWCVERGYFEYNPEVSDYSQVNLLVPLVPSEDEEIRFSVTVGDNLGNSVSSEGILVVNEAGNFVPEDPAPGIEFESPAQVKANVANWIRFTVNDLSADGADNSSFLVSKLSYSRESEPFETISDGIRGAIVYQNWVPLFSSDDVRMKLEVTDGNSLVDFVTPPFSIAPRYKISGTVLNEQGEPEIDALVEFQFGEHTTFYTRSTSPFGFYEVDVTDGFFTISLPESDIPPLTVEVSEVNPSVEVDFVIDEDDDDGTFDEIEIDIKPGSDENPINHNSNGKIPVAILSSPDFNAPIEVDQPTLTFGRTGNEESLHYRGNGLPNCSGDEDHNDDGLNDLLCHFHTPIAGFQPGDTEGLLRGVTFSSETFEGRDNVTIVGPGVFSSNFDSGDLGDWTLVIGEGES